MTFEELEETVTESADQFLIQSAEELTAFGDVYSAHVRPVSGGDLFAACLPIAVQAWEANYEAFNTPDLHRAIRAMQPDQRAAFRALFAE